VLFKQIFDLTS